MAGANLLAIYQRIQVARAGLEPGDRRIANPVDALTTC